MNEALTKSLEIRQIPTNFCAVIADDQENHAQATTQALIDGFSSGSLIHGDIYQAGSAADLFQLALFGKKGKQADVVILDDDYNVNLQPWKIQPTDILKLAERANINLIPVAYEIPGKLYDPNSTHLAILLRILDFEGNIFVVSSSHPNPKDIISEVRKLVPRTDIFPPSFPINGISTKFPSGGEFFVATKFDQLGWVAESVSGGLGQAMQYLFTSQH